MSKNKYSNELINEVLKEFDNGVEVPILSKKYNIPKQTIYSWIRKNRNKKEETESSINVAEILLENEQLKEKLKHIKYNLDLISNNI